jgi:hypothetical protein
MGDEKKRRVMRAEFIEIGKFSISEEDVSGVFALVEKAPTEEKKLVISSAGCFKQKILDLKGKNIF